jgi:hypothetical protein
MGLRNRLKPIRVSLRLNVPERRVSDHQRIPQFAGEYPYEGPTPIGFRGTIMVRAMA